LALRRINNVQEQNSYAGSTPTRAPLATVRARASWMGAQAWKSHGTDLYPSQSRVTYLNPSLLKIGTNRPAISGVNARPRSSSRDL
jgi:hypothetical protein